MQSVNVKTRKLVTMRGGFHPQSSVLRLNTKRREGGWGQRQSHHPQRSSRPPGIHQEDGSVSECLRQLKPNMEEEPEGLSRTDKPLHGMYHLQTEEMADIRKTYQWLEKDGLKDSTETLIMAAEEQALNTRSMEAGVYHTRQDPRCRTQRRPQCSTSQQSVRCLQAKHTWNATTK